MFERCTPLCPSASLSEQLWRHIPPNSALIQIGGRSSAVSELTFSSFSWMSMGLLKARWFPKSQIRPGATKSTVTDHTNDFPAAYMRESSLDRVVETDQPKLHLLDITSAQRIYSASSATCS